MAFLYFLETLQLIEKEKVATVLLKVEIFVRECLVSLEDQWNCLKRTENISINTLYGNRPARTYLFKVYNGNNRTICEIWSKLMIKIPKRRHWRRSGAFIVDFKHFAICFLVFLLLTLNKKYQLGHWTSKIPVSVYFARFKNFVLGIVSKFSFNIKCI